MLLRTGCDVMLRAGDTAKTGADLQMEYRELRLDFEMELELWLFFNVFTSYCHY